MYFSLTSALNDFLEDDVHHGLNLIVGLAKEVCTLAQQFPARQALSNVLQIEIINALASKQ